MIIYSRKFTNERGEDVLFSVKHTKKGVTIEHPSLWRRALTPMETKELATLLVEAQEGGSVWPPKKPETSWSELVRSSSDTTAN